MKQIYKEALYYKAQSILKQFDLSFFDHTLLRFFSYHNVEKALDVIEYNPLTIHFFRYCNFAREVKLGFKIEYLAKLDNDQLNRLLPEMLNNKGGCKNTDTSLFHLLDLESLNMTLNGICTFDSKEYELMLENSMRCASRTYYQNGYFDFVDPINYDNFDNINQDYIFD